MNALIKSEEVSKKLGISRATLSRMVNAGEIPYVLRRQGKRKKMVMFDETALEKWVARGGMRNRPEGRPFLAAQNLESVW